MIRIIRKTIRIIRNIIFWFPVIVRDQDYDYAFMYTILAKKLESMELDSKNWVHLGAEKDRLRIKTAKVLCRRLANEVTYNPINLVFPDKNSVKFFYYEYMKKQDLSTLIRYLGKYSLGWWD